MFCILFLLLFVTNCESSLKLVFSDEFNENTSIDLNKWDVVHEEDEEDCKDQLLLNQLDQCLLIDKINIFICSR